uniref:Putative secreted protein n=1 Tax=Anopheles marajoara TaxID=58244 RepID=A0A2M4CDA8_9DIPT
MQCSSRWQIRVLRHVQLCIFSITVQRTVAVGESANLQTFFSSKHSGPPCEDLCGFSLCLGLSLVVYFVSTVLL